MDQLESKQPKCIFCGTTNPNVFSTKEHILPESLIGETYALLPDGYYCDECQNIFGSSIQQQALADFPFINFRIMFSIPTKKQKSPWMNTIVGKIFATDNIGILGLEPNELVDLNKMKQLIIPAFSKRPDMILRTLLKIGIEIIATSQYPDIVYEKRYDAARKYALTGIKETPWFYIFTQDIDLLNKYLNDEVITYEQWHSNIYAYIQNVFEGLEVLHLKLAYLEFIVPITENVQVDEQLMKDCHENEPNIFLVTV